MNAGAAGGGYPPRYEAMLDRIDMVSRASQAIREDLQEMTATAPYDGIQLGKAIAFIAVAEDAAKDAARTIGRATCALWLEEQTK